MTPRAYWKGYLRLSLVTCPIELFPMQQCRTVAPFTDIRRCCVVAYFSTGFSGVNWNLESFHFTILSAVSFSRLRMSGTAASSAKKFILRR